MVAFIITGLCLYFGGKAPKIYGRVLLRLHHAILFFIFDLVNNEVFIITNYSIFDSNFTEPCSELKVCLHEMTLYFVTIVLFSLFVEE